MENNQFVVAKKNIITENNEKIEINDVGILIKQEANQSIVFFIPEWKEVTISSDDVEIFDFKETGDAFPKKICNMCHKLLDTNLFAKNQNGINNRSVRRPSCRDCRRKMEGRDMNSAEKREWNRTKPHIQPFKCPICGKKTIAGVTSKIVLDHDHLTGEIRGWICDSCNTGIGRFQDNTNIMRKAIRYLESKKH